MRFRRHLAARLSLATAIVLGVALVVPTFAATPLGPGKPITIALTGAAEAPDPGDPDGSGSASFSINPGTGQLCYDFSVTGVVALAAAHIHRAPVGEPGPVVIPTPPTSNFAGSGCVTADRDLLIDIVRNPDQYYFNVHNAEYMPGALRGQLSD
jgi:hypothetical protein